jgi:hypothetical protein
MCRRLEGKIGRVALQRFVRALEKEVKKDRMKK